MGIYVVILLMVVSLLLFGGLAGAVVMGPFALVLSWRAKTRLVAVIAALLGATSIAIPLLLWRVFKFAPGDPWVKYFWVPIALGAFACIGTLLHLPMVFIKCRRLPPKIKK